MIKRFIDIVLSLVGIVVLTPFLPFLAFLIKLDSKGPVLYLCERVGKDGKTFKMYKFRTMYDTPIRLGASVSPEGDPRVTSLGRILRRTKVNELPQLINILKGDMTFVGPRPEAPDLAALYPAYARELFTVKPGLVGPNQILGRNEEEYYPQDVDPQQYYIESILPKKLPIDLEYVGTASVFTDLKFIALGLWETVFKALSWKLVLQNSSQIYLLFADCFLSLLSFSTAHMLRFGGFIEDNDLVNFLRFLPIILLIRIPCAFYFDLYSTLIRYISYADVLRVFQSVSIGSLLFIGFTFLLDLRTFSRSVLMIDWLCLLFLMSSLRLSLRLFWERKAQAHNQNTKIRVLIFGAGDAGVVAYRFLTTTKDKPYEVMGFLDDDPIKRYKTLYGKKILGNRYNIDSVIKLYQIHEVFLAVPSAPYEEVQKIIRVCQNAGVKYRIFPTLQDRESHRTNLTDIFEMHEVKVDFTALQNTLQGKRILIAGAHGALGMELCRHILLCAPEQLIILERYEPYLTELMARLPHAFPETPIVPVLYSPESHSNIAEVCGDYTPQIIIHNATRKYLPFFPFQMESIIRANYLLTFTLAKYALRHGCEHFILVSSEEAAQRGNLIADSLRVVEIGLRQFFASHQTRLVIARLCDIMENRGSVIARLEEQIYNRETITLPHREAQCTFLSKHAAAHFILGTLLQVERLLPAEGIFVCQHSTTLCLLDIVQRLAMLKGLQVGRDISVKFFDIPSHYKPPSPLTPLSHHPSLVHTANESIRLLKDQPLSSSPETIATVQALLDIQKQDLENDAWEHHVRTLLLCRNPH